MAHLPDKALGTAKRSSGTLEIVPRTVKRLEQSARVHGRDRPRVLFTEQSPCRGVRVGSGACPHGYYPSRSRLAYPASRYALLEPCDKPPHPYILILLSASHSNNL